MQIVMIVLVVALDLLLLMQFVFYVVPMMGLTKKKIVRHPVAELPSVSVIIACHNELENLKSNLQYIVNQRYVKFEIVIVDDNSDDGTSEYVDSLVDKYPNVRVLHNKLRGKKSALTYGIENATYDHFLFIDADCRPASPQWISEMMLRFDEENQLVLGYGELSGKTFAARFSAYDADVIALRYAGFANLGHPYMAVGRNLAYSRKLWETVGGFSCHDDIRSGDDDLFVIEASRHSGANVCITSDSTTISPAKESMSALFRQKSRHVSTSARYSFVDKFLSGGEIVSRALFFLASIVIAFFCWQLAVLYVVIRILFVMSSLIIFHIKTKKRTPLCLSLLFDIFAPFFYAALLFYKLFYRRTEW